MKLFAADVLYNWVDYSDWVMAFTPHCRTGGTELIYP